jgi:anti-anti-sigma factor
MSALELRADVVEKAPQVSLLKLSGDLNLATLAQLEAHLASLRKAGRLKVVVDLAGLHFISSSGLGAFLSTVTQFRQAGGDLVFAALSPKIQRVFDMVGFSRVLSMRPDVESAVESLLQPEAAGQAVRLDLDCQENSIYSGRPFQVRIRALDRAGRTAEGYQGVLRLKPAWGIVSPVQIGPLEKGEWQGAITLTGPGELRLAIQDGELEGGAGFQVLEPAGAADFPVRLSCPGCRQALIAASSDVHRCRTCNEILLVDRWGQAISLRKGGDPVQQPAQVFQMLVPSDVNILAQLRGFAVGLLKERGFEDGVVDDVELALEEALCNVVEHAYAYDPTQTIALRIILEKDSVSVLVRDTGKAFNPQDLPKLDLNAHLRGGHAGGLGRYLMETLMDYIDYRSSPEGNTLLMEKKTKKTA